MATDPFTADFIDRLEDRKQAYKLRCITGEVVHFSFYCCNDPPNLGVNKTPVCVLSAAPETQCTGVNVVFNIDNSYSSTGSLVGGAWEIDFGDGNTASGNWPGVGAPGNQNNAYAAAGVYTVEAYVTDTLAVRGTVSMTVEIVDCANEAVLIEQMYALSQTTGPWVRDVTEVAPAWDQRILGLTGNYLTGRDLKLDPHRKDLNFGRRHVWIATAGGPARSTTDTIYWTQLLAKLNTPRNDAGDFPAPVIADLDFYCVAFNPMNRDEVHLLAGTATRTWVYYTLDGGVTWDNWQVRR